MTNQEYFLEKFSKIYPLSHNIWRITEASAELEFMPLTGPMLDLGCGDGTYLKILLGREDQLFPRKCKKEIIGIDINSREIDKARALGIYEKLYKVNSTPIPLTEESIQTVFSNSVIEHIKDKENILKEVSRVLRPNGIFLFSVPTIYMTEYLNNKSRKFAQFVNFLLKHHWIQSLDGWRADLARYDLELLSSRYTLSSKNIALWEKFLIPSFFQHLSRKKLGWIPGQQMNKFYVAKYLDQLVEPADLEVGGNMILRAVKIH